jgi:hypothetical protein
VDQALSTSYSHRKKGEYIKIFKLLTDILRGEAFKRLIKDLPPVKMEIVKLLKYKVERSDDLLRRSTPFSRSHQADEDNKLDQIPPLLLERFPDTLGKAERLLKIIKSEQLSAARKFDFYFLNITVMLLKEQRDKIKHFLVELLELAANSPLQQVVDINSSEMNKSLKEELPPNDYDYLNQVESMIRNRTPIIQFINRFSDRMPDMLEELNLRLNTAGQNLFKRICAEGFTSIDETAALAGSRLHFESLIINIKNRCDELSPAERASLIPLLTGILKELPESYKWLVLDFTSNKIIELSKSEAFQTNLVNAFLELLEKKKGSDYFLTETAAFLQTAKFILRDDLKEKIENVLIRIKEEK